MAKLKVTDFVVQPRSAKKMVEYCSIKGDRPLRRYATNFVRKSNLRFG